MNNNKTSSPDHTGQETRTIDQFVDKLYLLVDQFEHNLALTEECYYCSPIGSVNRTVSRL